MADWRIGLSAKPKYRSDPRRYDGPFIVIATHPSGEGGIIDADGVLRIKNGLGGVFLTPASEWVTANGQT